MVEAARKYKRVVQPGTQRRSMRRSSRRRSPGFTRGPRQSRHGPGVDSPKAYGHRPRQARAVPAGVDYAMWQGPAPDRPFHPNRFHYNWHWFWNWGTGELGNNGIHGVDIARWGLHVDAPLAVSSGGGKYLFDDDQEVPDTQIVTWEFPTACLVWEHRMWSSHPMEGTGFGIAFYGDKGTLIIGEKNWRIEDGGERPPLDHSGKDGQGRHVQNFLDCVKAAQRRAVRSRSAISVPASATLGISLTGWDVNLPSTAPVKHSMTPKPIECSPANTAAFSRCHHRSDLQSSVMLEDQPRILILRRTFIRWRPFGPFSKNWWKNCRVCSRKSDFTLFLRVRKLRSCPLSVLFSDASLLFSKASGTKSGCIPSGGS